MSLSREVSRYKAWAEEYFNPKRSAEWECDYPEWESLYASVGEVIKTSRSNWSSQQVEDLLYAIARDNEAERIIEEVAEDPAALLSLARAAVASSEHDAKWQFAAALGEIPGDGRKAAEALLLILVEDRDEYVSRRSLLALGRLKSAQAEALAERAWNSGNEYQRAAALAVLKDLDSAKLERYLDLARQEGGKSPTAE